MRPGNFLMEKYIFHVSKIKILERVRGSEILEDIPELKRECIT